MIINNAVIPTRPIFCLRFLLDVGCKIFAKRNLRSPLGRGIYGNKAIVVRKELINPDKEKSDICLRSPNGAKSKIAKHKDEERMKIFKEHGTDGLTDYLGTPNEIEFDEV